MLHQSVTAAPSLFYTYDALGNLASRVDNSTGVGTQESFGYDSLNRLTTATVLGGAISPPPPPR